MKKKLWVLGEYVGHLVIGAAMFAALLLLVFSNSDMSLKRYRSG